MIGDFFYNLFITPLELIFEVIFYFLKDYPSFAIIAISIVMNFLALPLYMRADEINQEERDKVASMADRMARIKKAFKGDERYMVINTYYRQQHYKPIYALRSTFSLILQVPFFIAAYNFLSNPALLSGTSFLFLSDLGKSDQLLNFGSFSINLMPIIMTLINVVSSYIYLKGTTLREKIQTYGLAVIFLVLLYNSPSGLVFYWTLNQIFSVLKNIFMKLVKKRSTLDIFFAVLGVVIFTALLVTGILNTPKKILIGVIILLICLTPGIISTVNKKWPGHFSGQQLIKPKFFMLGGIFLSIFMGIVIPVSVISSSPAEFTTAASNPVLLVINNFLIYVGFFIVWLGIFYYMSGTVVRNIFTYVVLILSGVTMLDFMVFSKELGVMSTYLVFDNMPFFTMKEKLINLLCVAALAVALFFVMKHLKKIVPYIYLILILGSASLAAVNGITAASQSRQEGIQTTNSNTAHEKILHLSKDGKNVVIFMMDRAISGYLPYIFNEKPELEDKYAGFTYYPNTVSFGSHTNYALPALFGGYEYTPEAMNKRKDVPIRDKHDEALKLLPTLFSEEGYDVVVCDPAYAGYGRFVSDMSIYDDIDNLKTYVTYGRYSGDLVAGFSPAIGKIQKRNFFFYSLFRSVPTIVQNTVYNNGNYYADDSLKSMSCSDEFLYSYSVLYNLENLTDIEEGDQCNLFIMDNDTTHSPTILKTPEYEPIPQVNNDMFDNPERFTLNGKTVRMEDEYEIGHYHCNMAAYLEIGKWLDFLRANDVYDNTRIIILSDHGNGIGQFDDLLVAPDWDAEWVNSLLLFKDFDSRAWATSEEFMMTADMPSMAMEGLIKNPVNPFTGNPVTNNVNKEEQLITSAHIWNIDENCGNVYDTSDGCWWKVHGNVHDKNAWERVE